MKRNKVQVTDVQGTLNDYRPRRSSDSTSIKRLDLCVGDTIFANNPMSVLWIGGNYLTACRMALIGVVLTNPDWRGQYEHHKMKSNINHPLSE